MDLAELGIKDLLAAQRQALGDFNL
jgi:hypothetical protein